MFEPCFSQRHESLRDNGALRHAQSQSPAKLARAGAALPIVYAAPGLGIGGFAANLAPVTLGNIVGGSGLVGLVALVYWIIYIRKP